MSIVREWRYQPDKQTIVTRPQASQPTLAAQAGIPNRKVIKISANKTK